MLKRFWFKFSPLPNSPLNFGCGVTAHDYSDALNLLNNRVFRDGNIPKILEVKENVELSELDQGHVVSNMEPWIFRGIWFPKGYPEPPSS